MKQEIIERPILSETGGKAQASEPHSVIELSSSDSDSNDSDHDDGIVNGGERSRVSSRVEGGLVKKRRLDELGIVLPDGFLDPLPPEELLRLPPPPSGNHSAVIVQSCKQFWKAGDYDGAPSCDWNAYSGGMDHVRVHPKFLHSNATSHKWALGAFAELLDNSLDEVCNGATYVNVDVLENKKDGSRMLLIEDNGGGMDPDRMRQCMSLGYSAKSKIANTIGQYGNGFKTSTMRLGADVLVFSRWPGENGKRPTQSIGLLSYTFLRSTGKEDIVVPMLDYERGGREWNKLMRASPDDWNRNVETIAEWSPYTSEDDLLCQFNLMRDRGTRIIIYNLWEDDQGELELDFDADENDLQLRGVNREEKNIQMAKQYANSKHFLTYRHSLRSYASILYLRLPPGFRIILRGKDVEHHNVVNDMMMSQKVTYRPQAAGDGTKDLNMVATVTIGFVKDAKYHIDVQGFNVYHKNRLIKPFWRVWNPPGSDGRGVIGVLEANFVEPAHDKQGFERTTVLSRLEARLVQMQRTYWTDNCHKIGYAARRTQKHINAAADRETTPESLFQTPSHHKKGTPTSGKTPFSDSDKSCSPSIQKLKHGNGHMHSKEKDRRKLSAKKLGRTTRHEPSSSSAEVIVSDNDEVQDGFYDRQVSGKNRKEVPLTECYGKDSCFERRSSQRLGSTTTSQRDDANGNERSPSNSHSDIINQLREENKKLKERLRKREEEILGDLVRDLQSEEVRCNNLESQLQEAHQKIDELNKEQESLIDIFSEERNRRDIEEENLRKKLKDASNTIQELLDKVRLLEKINSSIGKRVH